MKILRLLIPALAFALAGANAADIEVTADITSNTTWTADNAYILKKPIFVTNGAELTIEPGTWILGAEDVANGTFGSLVITRGCKIWAIGSRAAPIHFTALEERDGVPLAGGGTRDITLEDSGFWGGLIILGNAILNTSDNPATGGNTIGAFEVEGFPSGGNNENIRYGGNNDADNSGALKFVSIRYGGFEFAQDEEINGLTLGAVGSGTNIKFVEIFNNQDDGVEMFGGTVDLKYMVMAFNEDESFDWDQGYRGRGQFWFAVQKNVGAGSNYGAEMDGGDGDDKTLEPYAIPVILNATYIGSGSVGTQLNPQTNVAWRMKDNTGGKYYNSVFDDYKEYAIRIDDGPTRAQYDRGNLASGGNVFGKFGDYDGAIGSLTRNGSSQELGMLNGMDNSNAIVGNALVVDAVDRTPEGALIQVDPRVTNVNNPVWDTTTMIDIPEGHEDFFSVVDFKGAFGTFNWAQQWTHLDRMGYMPTADEDKKLDAEIVNVSTRSLVGTNAGEEMNIGFIVSGNEPQTVLFIGKGPSLGASGVANALSDPRIQIHVPGVGMIAENDNWMDSPNRDLVEFSTIPPTHSLEAAEALTLAPGSYTMLLFGDGVGLGEIFIYR